jgi:hypothetical protein
VGPESIAALPSACPVESTNSAGSIADFPRGLVKRVEEITMRRSVDEYRSLLAGAVSTLANDSEEVREELYERARAELKAEFDKLDPLPSELEILEERLKLNLAIHDFEGSFEWTAAEVA